VAEAKSQELKKGAREEELLQGRAGVAEAEARRAAMEAEFKRLESLTGAIAPSQLDSARASFLAAKAMAEKAGHALRLLELGAREEQLAALAAEVDRAKAAVAKAQYFYDGTSIHAPVAGTVLERTVEVGETLRVEALTTSLCRIADLEQLEAEIEIPERDLAAIKLGQPCRISTESYPDLQYKGQLDWLAPMHDRARGIRQAKITIADADEKLAPDMNCHVQVYAQEPQESRRVVRLPLAAIDRQGYRAFVYVLQNEAARRREVELGALGEGQVEIAKGLEPGEIVLLPGDRPLRDGQRVEARVKPAAAQS
jgi:RND family efflux transporter MFP subunit